VGNRDAEGQRGEKGANRPGDGDASNVSSSATDNENHKEPPLENRNDGVYWKYGHIAAVYDAMTGSSKRKTKKRYRERMDAKIESAAKEEVEQYRDWFEVGMEASEYDALCSGDKRKVRKRFNKKKKKKVEGKGGMAEGHKQKLKRQSKGRAEEQEEVISFVSST
jgi:hypothetical protein